MKTTTNKNKLDSMIIVVELIGALLAVAVLAVTYFTPIRDYWYSHLIRLFLLLSVMALDICLTNERCKGNFVCPHCGDVHVSTKAGRMFCLYNNNKLYMRCPQCKKSSWQAKASALSDEA